MVDGGSRSLRFVWWNVDEFRHFDPARANEKGWPTEPAAYEAKSAAIYRVINEIQTGGQIDLLVVAEITRPAITELRDRLLPAHRVESLDANPIRPTPHIGLVFASQFAFAAQIPIVTPRTPKTTREMAVLDLQTTADRIRFIACHWPAFDGPTQKQTREDIARYLSEYVYDYLHEAEEGRRRHIVVLGDLNEEPFGNLEQRLFAVRSRQRARKRAHSTDEDVSRTYLYNCAWRLLGERRPHDGTLDSNTCDAGGTYYWRDKHTWHTLDHVICSGDLLGDRAPYLDEASLVVHCTPACLDDDGLPGRFDWHAGRPSGVSDHLPIVGRIVLQGSGHD